jgi:hypothetical protein
MATKKPTPPAIDGAGGGAGDAPDSRALSAFADQYVVGLKAERQWAEAFSNTERVAEIDAELEKVEA